MSDNRTTVPARSIRPGPVGTDHHHGYASANRKFYQLPTCTDTETKASYREEKGQNLLQFIEGNVLGNDKVFSGPYGLRKALYCDYIASGRDIIRNAVNASEHDAVIFTGSGCTGAVHKLIHALHLQTPPIVFVGPFEHHSLLLPWREMGSKVIRIEETCDGLINLEDLEQQLQGHQNNGQQLLIGCFAAASNITGILTDVDSVTALLHQYGALALWDYATAAPYVNIDMNPISASGQPGLCHKDAVFISAHKFVGGVQTPGILVVKKKLLQNPVPLHCGGGSVFFVRREAHRYLQEAEMREEGGTPAIVESIRAGLVFQLKEAVGAQAIMEKEHDLCRRAFDRWRNVTNLEMLGSITVTRLPIFSFLVRHPSSGFYLHYNYICTLLNDVFGIQARGGCACAGPYAQDLLGISEALAEKIEMVLVEDSRLDRVHLRRYREYSEKEIIRPGFSRLSLTYFLSSEAVEYVLEAVAMVAEHGWKLLPQYNFNPETGEWRHRQHQVFKDRKWLGHISYLGGHMTYQQPTYQEKGPLPQDYQDCLQQARQHFEQAYKTRVHVADQTVLFDQEVGDLRWFLLPSEALMWLQKPEQAAAFGPRKLPFQTAVYPRKETQGKNKVTEGQGQVQCPSEVKMKQEKSSIPAFQDGMVEYFLSGYESSKTLVRSSTTTAESSVPGCGHPEAPGTSDSEAPEKKAEDVQVKSCGELGSEGSAGNPGSPAKPAVYYLPCDDKKKPPDAMTSCSKRATSPSTSSSYRSNEDVDRSTVIPALNESVAPCNKDTQSDNADLVCARLAPAQTPSSKPHTSYKWHSPPKDIFKPTVQALEEYSMINDGDRVLVCLSGGKDSLSLLHTLRQYQFYSKKKGIGFQLGAVTVDPQTSSYDPSPLKVYLAQLGVPYFYEEQCIMESAQRLPECASICSYCSRMKRGRIYHCARREGYNVLALGQHLDDLAESFLMSIFHNGILRTMKACYTVQEGDLKVIRPLVFVREKDLRHFAQHARLPVISENCPACFEAPKERHRMKQLLAGQEVIHPRLFHSLLSAIKPVMSINKTGVNVKKLLRQQEEHPEEEDTETDDF